MVLDVGSISLNANLAKYREDIKAGRVRKTGKNRNRRSDRTEKTDNGSPKKPGCRTAFCY